MANEQRNYEVQIPFPGNGVDVTRGYMSQRAGTTPRAKNVRIFDPSTDRSRGGVRSGLFRFSEDTVNSDAFVQAIDHMVTSDATVPTSVTGRFIYSLTAANHGIEVAAGATGADIASYTTTASYAMSCSCWDDDNNVYIAFTNTTTGAVIITKLDSSGTLVWSNSGNMTVSTGSLRKCAGIVWISGYVYVAGAFAASPTYRILQFSGTTGGLVNSTWRTNVNLSANLVFSSSSINCLGRIGNIMGIECFGNSSNAGFRIIDTTVKTIAGSIYRTWVGTSANARSRVVSDGTTFFYTLASLTTKKVAKIGLGGVPIWQSTAMDAATVNSIAYDRSANQLVVTTAANPTVVTLSLDAGAQVLTGYPNSTAWSNIDSDGQGNYTLWLDSVASNDTMGINTTLSTVWGPTTKANTTHSGATTNKGKAVQPIIFGARQTRLFAVAGGTMVRYVKDSDGVWSNVALTSGGASLASSVVPWGVQNGLNMYWVDGSSYLKYTASSDTLATWTATAGSMPTDSAGRPGRLLANWRGRNVIADLFDQPHLVFMSAQYSPQDFDYNPTIPTAQTAWAGEDATGGNVGDKITCLIAYSDDTMLFGCDHSIWQMTGDPQLNGQLDRITGVLGMAWGRPFAIDPAGQVFFMGSDCQVYRLTPGALPVTVSQQIRRDLQGIDLSSYLVRMEWDLFNRGLAMWITPFDPSVETTNYFWDERTNSWWPDMYGDPSLNPVGVHVMDGDDPNDRIILVGGRDGKLRYLSDSAETDDQYKIASEVWIGPIMTPQLDEILNRDMQATLGDTSGDVTYEIYVGRTAEEALSSEPRVSGTWKGGRNPVSLIQQAAIVSYIRLSSLNRWAFERLRYRYASTGPVRRGL